jgi:hypothetical protein
VAIRAPARTGKKFPSLPGTGCLDVKTYEKWMYNAQFGPKGKESFEEDLP